MEVMKSVPDASGNQNLSVFYSTYVGDRSLDVIEEDLVSKFSSIVPSVSAHLCCNRNAMVPSGFIQFHTVVARLTLHGSMVDAKILYVAKFINKKKRVGNAGNQEYTNMYNPHFNDADHSILIIFLTLKKWYTPLLASVALSGILSLGWQCFFICNINKILQDNLFSMIIGIGYLVYMLIYVHASVDCPLAQIDYGMLTFIDDVEFWRYLDSKRIHREGEIGQLFVAVFGSTMLFGTLVGSLAKKQEGHIPPFDVVAYFLAIDMVFGGGGFTVSDSLAKVLTKDLDSYLMRYSHMYGSDSKIFSCLAELDVTLTSEPGSHYIDDVRRNLFGLLYEHPLSPLVPLLHSHVVDPFCLKMNRTEAVPHHTGAASLVSVSLLQSNMCYASSNTVTVLVLWVWTVSLPLTIVNASDGGESLKPAYVIGLTMWVIGFLIEVTADQQKLLFKKFSVFIAMTELRKAYCKNGTYKPHEWMHMMVVVLLLHLNCSARYALCGLNVGYRRSESVAFTAVNLVEVSASREVTHLETILHCQSSVHTPVCLQRN